MDHLQSMRVFVKVADLGSFARAASAMDIFQRGCHPPRRRPRRAPSARGCSTAPPAVCP